MNTKLHPVTEQALKYVKSHEKEIIEKVANLIDCPPSENPFSIFMAGSPGAGKTEFSKEFAKILFERERIKIVRIDADEIRDLLPQYNGNNSNLVQPAAALGVEKVYDYVQKKKQNVLLDGTFANFDVSFDNVGRALNRDRKVGIIYIYLDPLVAWDFTQKRERLEGRVVPKTEFIDSFFAAKGNVNEVKKRLGKDVVVSLIVKNDLNKIDYTKFNIDKIDNYLKFKYTREDLKSTLND